MLRCRPAGDTAGGHAAEFIYEKGEGSTRSVSLVPIFPIFSISARVDCVLVLDDAKHDLAPSINGYLIPWPRWVVLSAETLRTMQLSSGAMP